MSRFPDSPHGSVAFLIAVTLFLILPLASINHSAEKHMVKEARAEALAVASPTPTPKIVPVREVTPADSSEQATIIAYIRQVFGKDADDAIKVARCESKLNPLAVGHNTNGSTDTGIFQINSIHGVNGYFLTNWRTNVDIAKTIFDRNGWNAWTCATKWGALN